MSNGLKRARSCTKKLEITTCSNEYLYFLIEGRNQPNPNLKDLLDDKCSIPTSCDWSTLKLSNRLFISIHFWSSKGLLTRKLLFWYFQRIWYSFLKINNAGSGVLFNWSIFWGLKFVPVKPIRSNIVNKFELSRSEISSPFRKLDRSLLAANLWKGS